MRTKVKTNNCEFCMDYDRLGEMETCSWGKGERKKIIKYKGKNKPICNLNTTRRKI